MQSPAQNSELRALLAEQRNAAFGGLLGTWLPLLALLWGVAAFASAAPTGLAGLLAALGLVVGIGVMQYRLVMSCHEAVHKRLLFPLAWNERLGVAHAALVGVNFNRYRVQHLAHHASADIDRDPDAYIYRPILEAPPGWRRLAVLVFGVLPEIVEKLRQKGLSVAPTGRLAAQARRDSLLILVAQALCFAVLTGLAGPFGYFVFWLLPLLTVAVFLNRVRVFIEHGYRPQRAGLEGEALGQADLETIDLRSNALERYVLAPYRFNFHSVHHHLPSMPFYNLPQALVLLERQGRYHGRVEGTYLGLLVTMLAREPERRGATAGV